MAQTQEIRIWPPGRDTFGGAQKEVCLGALSRGNRVASVAFLNIVIVQNTM
jgi:hypothetical protein